MKQLCLSLILLASCSSHLPTESIGEWSIVSSEDRRHILNLEKERLELHENIHSHQMKGKQLESVQANFYKKELLFIEKRVQKIQHLIQTLPPAELSVFLEKQNALLFKKERQELTTIIDKYPNLAEKAQQILDEILSSITNLQN